MIKILHRFFYAWLFLTRLPAPPLPKATKEDWGRIAPYFSLIGFILGFILYFSLKFFVSYKLPVLFSALLVLFIWTLITGGLHLDGLMDTFDGINCQDPNRKIEAMKDSRVGAFGAMAGIFVILFKLVTLCTILVNKLFFIIIISLSLSRLIVIYAASFLSKNQDSGISSSLLLAGIKKPFDFLINLFLFILLFIFCLFYFHLKPFYILFAAISFFICLPWTYWLHKHFKGHSGDTFGALIELSEVTILSLGIILKNYL